MDIQQIEIQFLATYPAGFEDELFIADSKKYDDTKIKQLFADELSKENILFHINNNSTFELIKPVKKAISQSWMTSRFEKIAFQHFIKIEETIDIFFVLLYEVMYGDIENKFDEFVSLLKTHIFIDDCSNAAKWPIVSVFLYYTRKEFYPVKPNTTKKIAKLLGNDIEYSPRPNLNTYTKINKMYDDFYKHSSLAKTKEQADALLYVVIKGVE